jgi:hypothetical protein
VIAGKMMIDDKCIEPRAPEAVVVQHLCIVFETDKLGWWPDGEIIVLKGEIKRIDERKNDKGYDEE